jgi:alkylation response protein AidB-like acyl-CoA dehydrogenase
MSGPMTEFVARAGAFAREAVAPDAERNDREHRFPLEVTAAAAKLGLLGMTVPAEFGGSGVNMATYAGVARELGTACAGTTVGILVSNLSASCLVKFGSDEQKQKYLPGLCDFSRGMGSFCLSEAGSASDAAGLKATAVRDGDRYILNGQKVWITNGGYAGVLIVMAVTDASLGAKGISAFIVEPTFPGFGVGRVEDKLGQHASNTVTINLEDCVVPAANRLGPEGIGFRVAMAALDGGRIGVGGMANGIGRAALEGGIAYARARNIEHDQWAQWLIANTATDNEAGWLMVQRAAAMCDAGVPFSREAAMAKYFATEGANRAAAACLKLAGPLGFDDHGLAARVVRDARITAIYEGTSEIQKVVIARSLLTGLPKGL